MAWYRTGTVNLTNGSATVTGVGTAFVGAVQPGGVFVGPNGSAYEVQAVVSATELTLRTPYTGSTTTASAYGGIFPTYAELVKLTASVAALLSEYTAVKDGPGQGKFANGTLSVPGVRFTADEDTGMRLSSENGLSLTAGGVDQLTLKGGVPTGAVVQTGLTDSGAGKLSVVGAFGIGATGAATLLANMDATTTPGGDWRFNATTTGAKPPGMTEGAVEVSRIGTGELRQMATAKSGLAIMIRAYTGGAWSAWMPLGNADELSAVTDLTALAADGGVGEITAVLGQLSKQINGGRATHVGGSLDDPALKVGDVSVYSATSGTLSVAISGVERLRVTASGITVYGTVTTVP